MSFDTHKKLNSEGLRSLFCDYEKYNPVANYKISDIEVWPLLRILVIFAAWESNNPNPFFSKSASSSFFAKLKNFIKIPMSYYAWIRARYLDKEKDISADLTAQDIAFLSHSTCRSAILGGSYYDIFFDPFLECVQKSDLKAVALEFSPGNEYRVPRFSPSFFIEPILVITGFYAYLKTKLMRSGQSPVWFEEFNQWLFSFTGQRLDYDYIVYLVNSIIHKSYLFESWLKRIKPKFLFVVCWYNYNCMAAVLAANRLGIETLDYQHGLINTGNLIYTHWHSLPPNGYKLIPKYIWLWGNSSVQAVREKSPFIEEKFILGGNLWLNSWLAPKRVFYEEHLQQAEKLCSGFDNTILVTLNLSYPLDLLFQTIDASPDNWSWLVRIHPGMVKKEKTIKRIFEKIKHPNLEISQASKLPLYSLYRFVNAHITTSSTSALEAVPFGLTTLIIHADGKDIYQECIDKDMMHYAETPEQILSFIHDRKGRRPTTDFANYFADSEAMDKAIEKIKSHL